MSAETEFKIMFWNARGVRNKFFELCNLIIGGELDIIAVNETFLDENINLPLLPGYTTVRWDKSNHSGGLLFIIKSTIRFTQLDSPPLQLFECASLTIHSSVPFVIHLIYCPGGTGDQAAINSHFHNELLSLSNNNLPLFIIGDFNAKHRAWNCLRSNRSGSLLLDFINNGPLFLSHTDTPTYNPASSRMSPSTIDLILTDGRIPSSSPRVVEQLSSDHYPIQFELNCSKGPKIKKFSFNYSTANWEEFGIQISNVLFPLLQAHSTRREINTNDIDTIIEKITNAILTAQE